MELRRFTLPESVGLLSFAPFCSNSSRFPEEQATKLGGGRRLFPYVEGFFEKLCNIGRNLAKNNTGGPTLTRNPTAPGSWSEWLSIQQAFSICRLGYGRQVGKSPPRSPQGNRLSPVQAKAWWRMPSRPYPSRTLARPKPATEVHGA